MELIESETQPSIRFIAEWMLIQSLHFNHDLVTVVWEHIQKVNRFFKFIYYTYLHVYYLLYDTILIDNHLLM